MRSRSRNNVRRRPSTDSDLHLGRTSNKETAWDSDSDGYSLQDEELFDIEQPDEDRSYESDITDDFSGNGNTGPDDFGGDSDIDIEDLDLLLDGNENSPEYYLKGLVEFTAADFNGQDYSNGSLTLIDRMEELWKEYCMSLSKYLKLYPGYSASLSKYGDVESHPIEVLCAISSESIGILYYFFDWMLSRKSGKNGRKLRKTKKRSSLGTYWKVFRLVFERASGDKLDAKLNRKMHRALRRLADKYGLSNERREKRCMTVDDLKEQIYTALSTTKKSFHLGEFRILIILFHLLMAPTGCRPGSLLWTRFGDLRLSLVHDPGGGPHLVAIRFTPEHTKGYLGMKESNTFPIPEVLWDPCLLLSPHVFLLGILFANRAFAAENLTSAKQLRRLDIPPGQKEMPLPLREDLAKTFLFRKPIKKMLQYVMSTERLPYSTAAYWIKAIGILLGLIFGAIAYNLRYNAAMEFDKSADISDGLRNLAMQHADSGVLLKHYLSRQINADTGAITRGLEPQREVVKSMCSLGSSINKRRPIELTTEQSASVNSDPRVQELVLRRDKLRAESRRSAEARRKYKLAVRDVNNEKSRLRKALKDKIREEFDAKQAVIDIERQLAGMGFDDTDTNPPAEDPLPAHQRLLEARLRTD